MMRNLATWRPGHYGVTWEILNRNLIERCAFNQTGSFTRTDGADVVIEVSKVQVQRRKTSCVPNHSGAHITTIFID